MRLTRRSNSVVFDMKKVAYMWFFWRNQHNETMRTRPPKHTLHCENITHEMYAWPYIQEYPKETSVERAQRLGCIDKWIAVVKVRMTCADILEFTGAKAKSIWREWNKRQFKKEQNDNEPTTTTKSRRNKIPSRAGIK